MTVLCIGLCAAMVVLFSQQAMDSALLAAGMFVNGVLPALFPMMVLCRMLPSDGPLAVTALFSFASGSPASAQRTVQVWRGGRLKEPGWMLALTGVMSPMFFVGTLARWTGDARAAWTMLVLHWLSACITAAVWKAFDRQQTPPARLETQGLSVGLPAAISQSALPLMSVCGAMMLFSIASGVGREVLYRLLPAWTARNAKLLSLLWAFLEIGGGASAMVKAWEAPPFALLGAMCSFGGLSIWLQNLLFASECIRPVKLLWMRMLHGAVCYGLGLIIFP